LIYEEEPTLQEIQLTIDNLKSNKSATDIRAEILKCLSHNKTTLHKFQTLFSTIWRSQKTLLHFGHSKITAIWKNKGKKSKPNNYRGIQVRSAIGKIFPIILINRIKNWYYSQILDLQNGFRQGHSTTDGIHITKKTTLIIADKTRTQIYAIFIDLKSAFDHINRNCHFHSIQNRLLSYNKNNKIIKLPIHNC